MKLEFSRHIFEKYSNIKLNVNPSNGSRFVSCGRTDRHDKTVTFRNFANAPKNKTFRPSTGQFHTTQALNLYRGKTWENPQWMFARSVSTHHTPCDYYDRQTTHKCQYTAMVQLQSSASFTVAINNWPCTYRCLFVAY